MNEIASDRAGHERLAEWVRQYGRVVRGYVRGVVRNEEAADDIAQDVFRKAWQSRDSYREEGQARAYLLRIADRLAVDFLRRSGREVLLDEEGWNRWEPSGADEGPAVALEQSELREQLRLALDRLSPAQRRVLLLRFYGEMEFAEIAATLGCPLSTALSHCHRGLRALRVALVKAEER